MEKETCIFYKNDRECKILSEKFCYNCSFYQTPQAYFEKSQKIERYKDENNLQTKIVDGVVKFVKKEGE
jgi:hypothetical protein